MVANPGCYPTSVQLPLVPLLEAGLILADDIIIDAKSGGWCGFGAGGEVCVCEGAPCRGLAIRQRRAAGASWVHVACPLVT